MHVRKNSALLAAIALLGAPAAAGAQAPLAALSITAQEAARGSTLDSAGEVANDADFAAFARGQMQSDATIRQVDSTDASVTVHFAEPGRLLGLFPVSMRSAAIIAADGSARVTHPWYYFLAVPSADEARLAAALAEEATIFTQAPSRASVGATSTAGERPALSAGQKAQLLSGISMALAGALPLSVAQP
jgi:hypothetical protein